MHYREIVARWHVELRKTMTDSSIKVKVFLCPLYVYTTLYAVILLSLSTPSVKRIHFRLGHFIIVFVYCVVNIIDKEAMLAQPCVKVIILL